MAADPVNAIGSRREARETALGVLYAAEAQGRDLLEVLADRPDDLRGRRLLVQALMRLDDTAEAWRAQQDVLTLLGDQAAADDHAAARIGGGVVILPGIEIGEEAFVAARPEVDIGAISGRPHVVPAFSGVDEAVFTCPPP